MNIQYVTKKGFKGCDKAIEPTVVEGDDGEPTIDYKVVKYDYLLAADFKTDLIDGSMRSSQFGVVGSYLDKDFGYYHNKHHETDSVEKIFAMVEHMAYHNHNSDIYFDYIYGYLRDYDEVCDNEEEVLRLNRSLGCDEYGVIPINDYFWFRLELDLHYARAIESEQDNKVREKMRKTIYYRDIGMKKFEVPLFFHNGVKFDNTLMFNHIIMQRG